MIMKTARSSKTYQKFFFPFFLFLFFFMSIEETIGFVQIFDFWFLMDLHVLGCPEHDLTIFGKCLSDCVSVCLCICVYVTKILWQV